MVHLAKKKYNLQLECLYTIKATAKSDQAKLWELKLVDQNGANLVHTPLLGDPENTHVDYDDLHKLKSYDKPPPVALTGPEQTKLDPMKSKYFQKETWKAEAQLALSRHFEGYLGFCQKQVECEYIESLHVDFKIEPCSFAI